MKKIIIVLMCLLPAIVLADSFTIDSLDLEMTAISQYYPLRNYATSITLSLGDQLMSSRDINILFRDSVAYDSIANHSGVTWDSLIIGIIIHGNSLEQATNDTLGLSAYVLLQPLWVEGLGAGATDTCGACWDSANATSYTSCTGSNTDWTTNGALGSGTDHDASPLQIRLGSAGGYDDTLKIDSLTAVTAIDDTIFIKVPGTDVADSLNQAGILLIGSYQVGTGDCNITIRTDEYSNPSKPFSIYYFTEGAASEMSLNLGK